jgi:hypothetical protein
MTMCYHAKGNQRRYLQPINVGYGTNLQTDLLSPIRVAIIGVIARNLALDHGDPHRAKHSMP